MKANNHEKPVHDRRPVLGDLLGAGTCLEGQGGQEIAPGLRPMVVVFLATGAKGAQSALIDRLSREGNTPADAHAWLAVLIRKWRHTEIGSYAGAGAALMGLRRMLGDGTTAGPYLSVLCAFLLTMALAMALKWYAPIRQHPAPSTARPSRLPSRWHRSARPGPNPDRGHRRGHCSDGALPERHGLERWPSPSCRGRHRSRTGARPSRHPCSVPADHRYLAGLAGSSCTTCRCLVDRGHQGSRAGEKSR